MSDVAAEIKVGDTAPDFNLKDQDQKDVKLSDYRGKKNVVLAFYPLDWSPVCQGENKCLTDDFPKFPIANAELFGISATASSRTKPGLIPWTSSIACCRTCIGHGEGLRSIF